jgi:aldose 1-epimerase
LYTPENRKSIAIENLSAAPDCFNNKMGLQQLEPQAKIYFETTYQFNTTS